jgi:hypothetical protein
MIKVPSPTVGNALSRLDIMDAKLLTFGNDLRGKNHAKP